MTIETVFTLGIILIPFLFILLTFKKSKKIKKPLYHKVWAKGEERWLK